MTLSHIKGLKKTNQIVAPSNSLWSRILAQKITVSMKTTSSGTLTIQVMYFHFRGDSHSLHESCLYPVVWEDFVHFVCSEQIPVQRRHLLNVLVTFKK